jgi:hypothetical protein
MKAYPLGPGNDLLRVEQLPVQRLILALAIIQRDVEAAAVYPLRFYDLSASALEDARAGMCFEERPVVQIQHEPSSRPKDASDLFEYLQVGIWIKIAEALPHDEYGVEGSGKV